MKTNIEGECVAEVMVMNRRQRLVYFPSLHSNEGKITTPFKLLFEIVTKITINWWALILLWMAEKTRQRWLMVIVKQIPNSLSFFRIIATPIICYNLAIAIKADIHSDAIGWFMVMLVVICLDALDGPAARDLDAVSEFGARLDPASDKFCFFCIVITYCVASVFEYSLAFCIVAIGLALWCLHVELKLIRLSLGPFRQILAVLKQYDPEFSDPGAFLEGKIKFNLQMAACVIGWLGLIWLPADPTAILLMAITLFAARRYGDKSLGKHRNEFAWLAVVALILQYPVRWGTENDNVIPIRKPA